MSTFLTGVGNFFKGLGKTLVALAASRKATVAAVSQLVTVGVMLVPRLAPYADRIVTGVDLAMVVIIAGIAIEDAAEKHAAQIISSPDIQSAVADVKTDLDAMAKGG